MVKMMRVLLIRDSLEKGDSVNLQSLATGFNVSKRTVQRDMDDVKAYYANKMLWDNEYKYVFYDAKNNEFKLAKDIEEVII